MVVEESGDAPVEDDGAGGAEDAFWVELQSDCRAFGGVGGCCHDDGAGGGLCGAEGGDVGGDFGGEAAEGMVAGDRNLCSSEVVFGPGVDCEAVEKLAGKAGFGEFHNVGDPMHWPAGANGSAKVFEECLEAEADAEHGNVAVEGGGEDAHEVVGVAGVPGPGGETDEVGVCGEHVGHGDGVAEHRVVVACDRERID